MVEEITVAVHTGNVSFSFRTDREGSNLKEGFEAVNYFIASQKDLIQRASRRFPVSEVPSEEPEITLSRLDIPTKEKAAILTEIEKISRFDLFILLLHYAKRPLTYHHVMSISKELGKPIRYNWLDSEPHRENRKGFIKSDPVPGKKEKLYSLTERGKRKAEQIRQKLLSVKN